MLPSAVVKASASSSDRTITRRTLLDDDDRRWLFLRAASGVVEKPIARPPRSSLRVARAVDPARRDVADGALNGWYDGFGVRSVQRRPDCQPARFGSSASSKLKNAATAGWQ